MAFVWKRTGCQLKETVDTLYPKMERKGQRFQLVATLVRNR